MLYVHYFIVASWMFALGWFLGAIYVQNHTEETESPRAVEKLEVRALEKLEPCTECEAWRVVNVASVAAD